MNAARIAVAALAGAWTLAALAGGCSSTSRGHATTTRTPSTAPTLPATTTRTHTATAATTATPTPSGCTGSVPCNPTVAASGTQTPWAGGATISVTWFQSGCTELPFYEQMTPPSLTGFNFSTATIVYANDPTDDLHFHDLTNPGAGAGIFHNPNDPPGGAIDMGAVPLTDPSLVNPPDPATNTYSGCCAVQIIPGHSYFVRRYTGTSYVRLHIVCVDVGAMGSNPAVRFQWDLGF